MSAFILSPEAEEDVWCIWSYLTQESSTELADRVESELFAAFERLARMPGIGHSRTDLTGRPVFFFAVYQYLIVYRKSAPLEIAAVIHGKRDAERILKGGSL